MTAYNFAPEGPDWYEREPYCSQWHGAWWSRGHTWCRAPDFPPVGDWQVSLQKRPAQTDRPQNRKARIAELRQELERLEQEEKKARPVLAHGQVWRHDSGDNYIAAMAESGISLVKLSAGTAWAHDRGFGVSQEKFTYVGMAHDVVSVKEKAE